MRWFTRDWLLSHADDDSFRMPRLDSIAHRLIEDWLRPSEQISIKMGRRHCEKCLRDEAISTDQARSDLRLLRCDPNDDCISGSA